jgi:hypothetical protein
MNYYYRHGHGTKNEEEMRSNLHNSVNKLFIFLNLLTCITTKPPKSRAKYNTKNIQCKIFFTCRTRKCLKTGTIA